MMDTANDELPQHGYKGRGLGHQPAAGGAGYKG